MVGRAVRVVACRTTVRSSRPRHPALGQYSIRIRYRGRAPAARGGGRIAENGRPDVVTELLAPAWPTSRQSTDAARHSLGRPAAVERILGGRCDGVHSHAALGSARSRSVACLMAARVEADDRDNPTSGGGTNAVGGIRRKDAIREVPEPGPFRVIRDDLGAERSPAQSDQRIRP